MIKIKTESDQDSDSPYKQRPPSDSSQNIGKRRIRNPTLITDIYTKARDTYDASDYLARIKAE